MAKKKRNKNDGILSKSDLDSITLFWDNLTYKKYFEFLCRLNPNKETESLEIVDIIDNEKVNATPGLVYAFVLEGENIKNR